MLWAYNFIFAPHHNIVEGNIFWIFFWIWITWCHVTSHDVILTFFMKKCYKSADLSIKLCRCDMVNIIRCLDPYITFHLVGQPTFYDYWFSFYWLCSGEPILPVFCDDVIKKMLITAKKITKINFCFAIVFIGRWLTCVPNFKCIALF